jgi:hypothetical protein
MKTIFPILIAILASGTSTLGASVRYEAKIWRAVQTYDLATLSQNLDSHVRELVAMKCNFRGKDIHHMKPNWYEGSVWQNLPEQHSKFAHVRIMISKVDLPAFKSLPTDSSGAEITLYGRVEHDPQSNFRFVRLVGRNATLDPTGNAVVSW